MADDNKKKQNTAETDELTLEEKINKIKSREITEAEKGMLTLPAFEAACEAVKKVTQETRLIYSKYFSDHTGNKVYFKPENMQLTGAYKLRGAYYTIGTLTDEERQRGLITASAGNHAQGVAYAAQCYGVKAVIVMPTTTPLIKVERTKAYGAEVPIGGGGLATGVSTLAKMLKNNIKVIGVEPSGAACMKASLENGRVTTVSPVNTIADGTAVQTPGTKIFPYIQQNLDGIITVDDEELVVAFLDMVENHKMVVENSGLLTVAALKHLDVKGKKVVSILSGGNMDVITMSSVVQNGLIARDRIFTISVLLPDKPGELVRVSQVIADKRGNVIKLDHNQFFSTNRTAAVELKITLEAFGTEHKKEIIQALEDAGYKPKQIRPNL